MVQATIIKSRITVKAKDLGTYTIIGTDGETDWRFEEGRQIHSVMIKKWGGWKEKKVKKGQVTAKIFKKGNRVICNYTGKGGPDRASSFDIEAVQRENLGFQ
ncbi:hypothetical protein ACFL0V_05580 [Nanoarchaeota archaeon]